MNIHIRLEDGHYIATSPDVTGLLLIDETLEAVCAELPGAVKTLLELNGPKAEPAPERDTVSTDPRPADWKEPRADDELGVVATGGEHTG